MPKFRVALLASEPYVDVRPILEMHEDDAVEDTVAPSEAGAIVLDYDGLLALLSERKTQAKEFGENSSVPTSSWIEGIINLVMKMFSRPGGQTGLRAGIRHANASNSVGVSKEVKVSLLCWEPFMEVTPASEEDKECDISSDPSCAAHLILPEKSYETMKTALRQQIEIACGKKKDPAKLGVAITLAVTEWMDNNKAVDKKLYIHMAHDGEIVVLAPGTPFPNRVKLPYQVSIDMPKDRPALNAPEILKAAASLAAQFNKDNEQSPLDDFLVASRQPNATQWVGLYTDRGDGDYDLAEVVSIDKRAQALQILQSQIAANGGGEIVSIKGPANTDFPEVLDGDGTYEEVIQVPDLSSHECMPPSRCKPQANDMESHQRRMR